MWPPSQHDWYIYMKGWRSWQPGITAPSPHSSKICLIGFHHKAPASVQGPRRPERTARWKNKGRIWGAVPFWVIWLLPQEQVGWISHTAIWRISTHCVYCIQRLTPGSVGQGSEEGEQKVAKKRNNKAQLEWMRENPQNSNGGKDKVGQYICLKNLKNEEEGKAITANAMQLMLLK